MEHLWSPWRSRHLDASSSGTPTPDDERTLFARLAAEDRDEENLIVWRGDLVFVIMNLYPYNNGHVMIVPYREVAAYDDLTDDEHVAIARTINRCIGWLRRALNPDGFNVGMNLGRAGGAGVPDHVHVHVVPRWTADTNFMPTVGHVKVLPESLEDTYRKLRAAIAQDGATPKSEAAKNV